MKPLSSPPVFDLWLIFMLGFILIAGCVIGLSISAVYTLTLP